MRIAKSCTLLSWLSLVLLSFGFLGVVSPQPPPGEHAALGEDRLVQARITSGQLSLGLRQCERQYGGGYTFPNNVGFMVNLPHRESFSPDAAWYRGTLRGGGFLEGAPVFAVEIRRENDYGPAAEREMAAKRADYFACGTQVVWDVDVLREELIRVYRTSDPITPTLYRRGETADAEPAVLGWRMTIDDLFV